jgi:site-specific DNA recombinase
MRCAIYARYSSDLQRESSIEDQIRKCKEFAEKQGWAVLEECIRCDQAISGASLAGRTALQSLVEDAKKRPRPFDRILVDDTSRLARNVADGLRLTETLRYHGVYLTAVSQGIDSEQKTARQLLTLHGMMDEQFLVGLADKVHRGQEGRVLKGLNPGGRCYGYVNVPIEDPTRQGKYGRPAVVGVRLEIHEQQAEIVRRIFRMYAEGAGLAFIAKRLNAEGVPAPQPPRTRSMRAWCPSSIREMLRNERYRGVQVWNRTEKQRNPETGRKISRVRPESEWTRVEVPEWRITSDELWEAAHARVALVHERLGAARYGGICRTEQSRRYLFSGLLVCGVCGSRIVIISGRGRRGYVRYGCPSHRYRGVCSNKLTMRQDRVEEQLLAVIESRILTPEMLEYTLRRFQQELQRRLAEIRKQGSEHSSALSTLQAERDELQGQAKRLAEAIAAAGHSPTLLSHLASVEAQLAHAGQRIEAQRPVDLSATVGEIQDFVMKNVMQLRTLLHGDAQIARAALMKHVKKLVLTPEERPSGPVFAVSGGLELLGSNVMPVVARDGIEPPTPAFSGPRSTS